ncbi:MAG TPA: hypothetical protein VNV16_01160 [Methylibium sp.]|nr:hypothetical protein [Methylibium sp.]
MKLHVIPGTPAQATPAEQVRKRVRAMPKPAEMLQCKRCGGREVIETKVGVLWQAGKTKGGTKQLICASCLIRGERVVLA